MAAKDARLNVVGNSLRRGERLAQYISANSGNNFQLNPATGRLQDWAGEAAAMEAAAMKFQRNNLERAKVLMAKAAREVQMGFGVSEADMRELEGMLDSSP
jgi:hypothetical protein